MNPCEVLPTDSIILLTHRLAPTQRPVQTPLRLAAGGLSFCLRSQGCSAAPLNDDNPLVWAGSLFGPADTPWEGGQRAWPTAPADHSRPKLLSQPCTAAIQAVSFR